MLRDDDKITPFQLTVLLTITLIEIGILTLPRHLVSEISTDAWLIPIPSFLFVACALFFMSTLGKLFPGKTFVEYSRDIMGRFIGTIIVIMVVLFWVAVNARMLHQFADVVKVNLLNRTPIEVIIFSMLISAAYLARHGIEPMARLAIILFFVTVPIGIMLLALVLPQARLDNLFPILTKGPLPVLKTALLTVGNAEGTEMLLLLFPFLTNPKKGFSASLWAEGIVWFLVFQVLVVTVSVFGVKEAAYIIRPGMVIIQTTELPTIFVERLALVYMAIWVAVVFPSVSMFLFLAATSISRLFKFREQKIFIYPLIPIIYLISIIPENSLQADAMSKYLQQLGNIIMLILPPLLLLVAKLRGKGVVRE